MIVYMLKQDEEGQWSIECRGSALASGLQLGLAIKRARLMALTEHLGSGLPTCVGIAGAEADIHLPDDVTLTSRWHSATA